MARRRQVIAACVIVAMFLIGTGCGTTNQPTFPFPVVGSTATFQEYPRWDIGGTVTVVDDRTIRLDGFTFHGESLDVSLRLQRDDTMVAELLDLTEVSYDHATLELLIPDDVSLSDFNLITVYCPAFGSSVSGAAFR